MKLIKPSVEIIPQINTYYGMLEHIEKAARVCYKSEDKIEYDEYGRSKTAAKFVDKILNTYKHQSVAEHGTIYISGKKSFIDTFLPIVLSPHTREVYYNGAAYITTNYRVLLDAMKDNKIFNIDENLIYMLMKDPTEHHIKRTTVKFICSRACAQQLTRHRSASFCLSGDSIIKSFSKNKKWTVKQLYEWSKDPKRNGRIKLMNIRSVDNNGIVIKNKIKNIFYTGKKEVYKVTTESGRNIKTTLEHRYLTPNGYIKLKDLNIGDYVYSNGKELLNNKEWLIEHYLNKNKTRKEIALIIGCCESTLYKSLKKFNIIKPHSKYPNRHGGCSHNYMLSCKQREHIGSFHKGKKAWNYTINKKESGSRRWARVYYKANHCELCGKTENLEQHHIDKNPLNYNKNNVITLCRLHHKLMHSDTPLGVFKDKITSIERIGTEDTYDIEMVNNPHNFVANGIVVHNSMASQRYCNYSKDKFGNEITYIYTGEGVHPIQAELYKHAEHAYLEMIEKGYKPQQARMVLPNATMTELIMTAYDTDWKNIFDLRCSPHADDEIRQLCTELKEKMNL